MATLKADIGEQAAEVHRNHKFNSGATEPTGDSSPTKLASGLVGTAEVMPTIQLDASVNCLHRRTNTMPGCHLNVGLSCCPVSLNSLKHLHQLLHCYRGRLFVAFMLGSKSGTNL